MGELHTANDMSVRQTMDFKSRSPHVQVSTLLLSSTASVIAFSAEMFVHYIRNSLTTPRGRDCLSAIQFLRCPLRACVRRASAADCALDCEIVLIASDCPRGNSAVGSAIYLLSGALLMCLYSSTSRKIVLHVLDMVAISSIM